MSTRFLLLANLVRCVLMLSVGCSSKKPDTPDKESLALARGAVPAQPTPSTPEKPAEGGPEDVAGLKTTVSPDGRIKIEGTDIFGSKLDSVYESANYLVSALPVLKRSLTPEQVDGLAKVAARLGGKMIVPAPNLTPGPDKAPHR